MIKVFNSKNEYDNYTQGGLVAGDLYYVLADGSVHFRSNNIDGEDKVYDKGDGAPISTDTKITIGFRNTSNLYGLRYIKGISIDENLYLGETNLGTIANVSYNEGFSSVGPNGYLQKDGTITDTPDNHFVSDKEITWVKLNGVKEHTLETLPQSLEIPLYIQAYSKDGVGAPLYGIETSITLPSDIEGKNCILVYDFVPDTTNNTYFTLSEDNSFII
jgi:hypothetical protein